MPGAALPANAVVTCPHGGKATITPKNLRVKALGQFVALATDPTVVAGCTFTLPLPKPSPCVKVTWQGPAARVKVMGTPILVQSSVGTCQSAEQAPQGPTQVAPPPPRVKAQ